MKTFEFESLDYAYHYLIKAVYEEGKEVSPRNMLTKEISPVTITITNPRNRVISHPERKLNYGFMVGEPLWYLSGTNLLAPVAHYNSSWNRFTDDGVTLNGAYGHRIFNYKEVSEKDGVLTIQTINQFNAMIEKFKKDKDSRHGTILIFKPSDLVKETKDVPCNNMLRFSIRDNKLNLMNIVRSNDVVFGLPYDMHFFMLLQEIAASILEVDLGNYIHIVDSLHIYEMHFEMAQRIIDYGPTNIYNSCTPNDFGFKAIPNSLGNSTIQKAFENTLNEVLKIEKQSRIGNFNHIKYALNHVHGEGWKNYARIIIAYNAKKHKDFNLCNEMLDVITNEFKQLCDWRTKI